jgi:hypothetical protein
LILALAAAGLGILVSQWRVGGLVALAPISLLETVDLGLDGRVLLYILDLSMVTAIVFTLAPALTSGRESLGRHLAAATRTVTRSTRLRQGLVVRLPRVDRDALSDLLSVSWRLTAAKTRHRGQPTASKSLRESAAVG